jgi:DNA repair exonuclease SbcCD ATPase subunit
MLITFKAILLLLATFFCINVGLYIMRSCFEKILAFIDFEDPSTALANERLKKNKRLAALKKELNTTKAQLKIHEAANVALSLLRELAYITATELNQQVANKVDQLHAMAMQIKDQGTTIASQEEDLNRLQLDLNTAQSSIRDLHHAHSAQLDDLEDYEKLLRTTQEQRDSWESNSKATISALSRKISELLDRKAELEGEKEALSQELEVLRSWYLRGKEGGERDANGGDWEGRIESEGTSESKSLPPGDDERATEGW